VTEFGRRLSRSLRPAMEDATFSKFPSQGQRPDQAKNRGSFPMLGIKLKKSHLKYLRVPPKRSFLRNVCANNLGLQ
jgi:hypothetical protein